MCGRCQVVDFLPPGLWGATVRAPPSPLRANEKRSSWFSRSLDCGNRYIFLNFELSSLSRPFPLLFPIVNRRLLEQLWRLLLYVLVLPSWTGLLPPSEIDKSMAALLRRFSARKSFWDGGTILLPYLGPS